MQVRKELQDLAVRLSAQLPLLVSGCTLAVTASGDLEGWQAKRLVMYHYGFLQLPARQNAKNQRSFNLHAPVPAIFPFFHSPGRARA